MISVKGANKGFRYSLLTYSKYVCNIGIRSLFGIIVTIGLVSCQSTEQEKWEKQLREGTKLMLEPRDYKDSEQHLDRAMAIARNIGGAEGERLESLTLPVLWNAKLRLEKLSEAEALLRRNIELDTRLRGVDDRDLAYPIGKLARLLADQSRHSEAKPLYLESLRIEQLNSSPKSFSIADLQLGLGIVEIALGDTVKGDSLYLQALSIYRTSRRPDLRYQKALDSYRSFLLHSGRMVEANYVSAELDSISKTIDARRKSRAKDSSTTTDS